MKKIYLLFLFIGINCFSQINFDKGYFIENSGTKIECLIRNIDWLNNPIEFEYKESENSEQKTITIKDVQEFGIYDNSKYIKANLNIDLSSNNLDDLSDNKEIIFEEKELFLKVLIEGEASLYEYVDGKIVKFFFKNNNTEIEQLIFKKYKSSQNQIGSNEEYKKQLWLNLKCDDITLKTFKYVDYKENDLVDFFVKYNTCINVDYINYKKKISKIYLILT
tara:strand:+ start:182 stop:844 length:663 start_codon:yes stop_codon:yes gene_type:complete